MHPYLQVIFRYPLSTVTAWYYCVAAALTAIVWAGMAAAGGVPSAPGGSVLQLAAWGSAGSGPVWGALLYATVRIKKRFQARAIFYLGLSGLPP